MSAKAEFVHDRSGPGEAGVVGGAARPAAGSSCGARNCSGSASGQATLTFKNDTSVVGAAFVNEVLHCVRQAIESPADL